MLKTIESMGARHVGVVLMPVLSVWRKLADALPGGPDAAPGGSMRG